MITYNEIYEAARKERYSEQLQKLSKNFVENLSQYLKEKKEMSLQDDNVFSDVAIKTKKQLENAVTLFKELMVRRRKKILGLVLVAAETGISRQDFENMLAFEKELFEDIMKCIEASDKKLNSILNGAKTYEQVNDLVLLLSDIDEFVGFDGSKIGPFSKGQIANIPKEIAKILIDDNKAEKIEK